MRPAKGPRAQTIGSAQFEPGTFFDSWAKDPGSLPPLDNDLRTSITTAFNLPESDNYVYHAVASVTLKQMQEAIEHGGQNGLHAWYTDGSGKKSEVSHCSLYRVQNLMAYTPGSHPTIASFSFADRFQRLRQRFCLHDLDSQIVDCIVGQCKEGLPPRIRGIVPAVQALCPLRLHHSEAEKGPHQSVLRLLGMVVFEPRVGRPNSRYGSRQAKPLHPPDFHAPFRLRMPKLREPRSHQAVCQRETGA